MNITRWIALLLLAMITSACAILPASLTPNLITEARPSAPQLAAAPTEPTMPASTALSSSDTATRSAASTLVTSNAVHSADELPAVLWQRRGGRMRTCQALTIYSSGQFTVDDCLNNSTSQTWSLESDQAARLADYLGQFSAFKWNSPIHKGLADLFVDHYTFNGQGNQLPTAAKQGEINTFLAQIASSAPASQPTRTGSAGESGIEGRVALGPACPGPVKIGQPCPDVPWQGVLLVLNAQDQLAAEVQTGEDGTFRIALPPGTYTIRPQHSSPGRMIPGTLVVVQPGQFTFIGITIDSGMR